MGATASWGANRGVCEASVDNSRNIDNAFTLVRVQTKTSAIYDCREHEFGEDNESVHVASAWLSRVAPQS
jgi:hypothetical protein